MATNPRTTTKMALRKQPVNVGILFEDNVLYSSDPDLRPVLDLAKFSISFAKNLVRDAELSELVHEPSMALQQGDVEKTNVDGKLHLITQEHVMFKFITNRAGETVAVCATYPSSDDLKALDIALLTPQQLTNQASEFIEILSKRFVDAVDFMNISIAAYTQAQKLELYEVMTHLFEEVVQGSQVILKDDYATIEPAPPGDAGTCTFLFASAMYGSVPCASRFFENMDGFFRVRIDAGSDAPSVIENLISAQLSTIVTTSLSVAKTIIRSVELQIKGAVREGVIYITFYPIKNNYALVFIAKGSPTTLRFFTEATASVLANLPALDDRFTGDLGCFDQVNQILKNIPASIESQDKELDLDEIAEDLYTEVLVDDETAGKTQKKEKEKDKDEEPEEHADESELQFNKIKNKLFKLQSELNSAMASNNLKAAAKRAKEIWNIAVKIKNKLLAMYYENKLNTLNAHAKQ
ncbi:MAG: hypothetical protein JW839_15210 [Candidatus Lokiarchaeota archaeon]|nr:hypothetical protein [Candidatus Lokiarchaeota archaeon]